MAARLEAGNGLQGLLKLYGIHESLAGKSQRISRPLLIDRLMECGKVTDFWEKTDCKTCSQFRNSHDARRNHFEWDFTAPSDLA